MPFSPQSLKINFPLQRLAWFWIVAGFSLVTAVVGQSEARDSFPTSPLNPTFSDCANLSVRFYRDYLRLAHEQLQACMRQPPQFGKGQSCSGHVTTVAWAQCNGEEATLCQIEDVKKREEALCRQRARAQTSPGQNSREDAVDKIKRAEAVYEKARGLKNFINDPIRYLTTVMNPFPNTVDRLYSHQRAHNEATFDRDLGYQLYHYAHRYAQKAVSITPNPIIRKIQQEALRRLEVEYSRTLSELAVMSADIADFRADRQTAHPDKLDPPGGYVPESSACKVIGTC